MTLGEDDGWTTFRNVPVRRVVASDRTNGAELDDAGLNALNRSMGSTCVITGSMIGSALIASSSSH
ncbi:hypothetical protein HKX69_22665 [Streptomyces argyrophyllae]|uniref:Uncharacterized protein n=1 Tax=Streptomyces argyrophylli TaxID=2726118 RepID=A0A6M4PQJ3_9ACTN|nr:hypothetical protein [Streptomyces argyrophyllae]QJS11946.1 hypothetical protein HKX69_22665 [Streptomyces argyrophyllae]